jgi:bis(5'-nucleosyl)-tetraphosphatase (symmetrical)
MSSYVIGDVQGCYDELCELLSKISFNPQTDTLYFLGDLINRGPKNLETINLIRSLPRSSTVLGNHDLHFLAVASGCRQPSNKDTFEDILNSSDLAAIVDWFRQQPLVHSNDEFNCTFVHAGIPHIWTVEKANTLAREVETVLKGDGFVEFLENMYGNTPAIWHDALEGSMRHRTITNYLTRMRFSSDEGELELSHKSKDRPKGFSPWFNFARNENDLILFGHWAALEGSSGKENMLALDTGCVWGRELTAYCLENKRRFSVSAINR